MSTSRELAHDFVVAMEARDWERANELVLRLAPLNRQLELTFLGREGDTLSATMTLSESVRGFAEGTINGGYSQPLPMWYRHLPLPGLTGRKLDSR